MVFFADQMPSWGLTLVNTKTDHQHKIDTEQELYLPLIIWQWPLWCPDEREEENQWHKCSKFFLVEMWKERLHYLWVRLYSLIHWMKIDQTFCREESIVHYYPLTLACSSQLQWKDSLKIYFNPPFLCFSGETHEKASAFLSAEVTRKYLIEFCRVQEQRKRQRETGRETGRLLSLPPVIWLSSRLVRYTKLTSLLPWEVFGMSLMDATWTSPRTEREQRGGRAETEEAYRFQR